MIAWSGIARNGIADLDETIGLLYEAAHASALWPSALRQITAHEHGTCSGMQVLDPNNGQPIQGLFDEWSRYGRYQAHHARLSLRNAYAVRLPTGSCFSYFDRIVECERDWP